MSVALIPCQAASDSGGRLGRGPAPAARAQRASSCTGRMTLLERCCTPPQKQSSYASVTRPGRDCLPCLTRRKTAAGSGGQAGRCDVGGQRRTCRGEDLVYPGTLRVQCLLVAAQLRGCGIDLGWRRGGQTGGHIALDPLRQGESPGDKVVHRLIKVKRGQRLRSLVQDQVLHLHVVTRR